MARLGTVRGASRACPLEDGGARARAMTQAVSRACTSWDLLSLGRVHFFSAGIIKEHPGSSCEKTTHETKKTGN
eukprot:1114106-Pyramimonas_sp.AAC.1